MASFDVIDHHLLMERVRRRIQDRKVLRLVLAFLKAGILIEGTVRHPVTGTPQGGVLSPLLANVYLTSLDERYGRWTSRPRERLQNAADRRHYDRKRGRPTFQIVRYADDFVILVTGTKDEAMAERDRLAAFLLQELHMELSLEKTLVTEVENGFDFLGYRVIRSKALRTGHLVGKLHIPKGKLQRLRDAIKTRTKTYPTGASLVQLIRDLNPIIHGWRTYYRYATGASREFNKLDWWLSNRVLRWLRKKHRTATWTTLRRYRVPSAPGKRRLVWGEGKVRLRSFVMGGTMPYPTRSILITNGWDDAPKPRGTTHVAATWGAFNRLIGLTTLAT